MMAPKFPRVPKGREVTWSSSKKPFVFPSNTLQEQTVWTINNPPLITKKSSQDQFNLTMSDYAAFEAKVRRKQLN